MQSGRSSKHPRTACAAGALSKDHTQRRAKETTGERIVDCRANIAVKYFLHSPGRVVKVTDRDHLFKPPPGEMGECDLFMKGGFMRKFAALALLIALFLAATAHGQEQFSFNGVKFGVKAWEQGTDIIFAPTGDGKFRVSKLPDIGIEREWTYVDTIEGNVEMMAMGFKSADAKEFAGLITEKFGKPDSVSETEIQTMRGVKLTRINTMWITSGVDIFLMSRTSSDVTKAGLTIKTSKYKAMQEEKTAQEKKKAKGNL